MKITVIGQWGGYPGINGATAGYMIQQEDYNLLIDCGSAVLSNLQRYIALKDLSAVVLSHYHYDHIADIGPLHYARLIETNLGQVKETLNIYGHRYDRPSFEMLTKAPYTQGVVYNEDEELKLGPFSITFLKTKHPAACFAMKIKTSFSCIVYTADSSYMEEFIDFSKDADLLICECNFYGGQDGSKAGHMNSREAATIAREGKVKKLVLTHLPHFGNHEDLVIDAKAYYKGEVELARLGLVWEG